MADGIKIEGLPPLRKILKEVGSLRPVKKGLGKGAVHLKGTIDIYPKQRPPTDPRRIYIRGVGTRYLPTGKTYRTSENLADKWTVRSGKGGLEWKVGNNVSYGPLVQDREKQTRYHKATGWSTTQKVVEDENREVNQIVKIEIDRALEGR